MHRPLTALAVLSGLLVSATGLAYKVREAAPGKQVRWATDAVTVVIDPTVAEIGEGAEAAIGAAFAEWTTVPDTVAPRVTLAHGPADGIGYRKDHDNRSTVRFAGDGTDLAGPALAVTIVTYDAHGEILDADVVVNGGKNRHFGVGDLGGSASRYDLQAVVTHEVGHFLGLGDEAGVDEATMFPTTARGEVKKRDLSGDDESGLQALYLDEAAGAVESESESESEAASCAAAAPGRPGRSPLYAAGALGIGAWLLARRRRAVGRRGAAATTLSLALIVAIPSGRASASPDAPAGHVVAAQGRWDGGIVVTRLAVEVRSCAGAARGCALGRHDVEVLGGTVDEIRQIVGHDEPPVVGEMVATHWEDGQLTAVRRVDHGSR